MENDEGILKYLRQLHYYGFSLVENAPTGKNSGAEVESCLPTILDTRSTLGVVDDQNNIVGSISDKEVASILRNN